MNREIKFRGKLLESSSAFKTYKKGTVIEGGFCKKGEKYFIVAHFNVFEVSADSLSEFTGIKDVDGLEIFENDTVLFEEKNYKVIFQEGAFCLNNEEFGEIISMYDYYSEQFKVIEK